MKFNKWTLGLAAVGVVSLASAARADESATKISQLNTALSNTTISGYVDVAAQFNPGGGGGGYYATPNYSFGNKANGINLNVVDIALDKPLDESPWASGYHVELWFGADATALGTTRSPLSYGNNIYYGNYYSTSSPAAIRQAYISLRTPIGNGIDWKIGVWDTIIGYEGTTSGVNPNYSRSFGYNMEPTTHTGVLGTYKVADALTISAGLADTSWLNGGYTASYNNSLYYPTVLGLVTLTAPDSFGWAKGATLTGGIINTSGSQDTGGGATSWYAGFTLPTPVSALKLGGAFDYLNVHHGYNSWDIAGYGTFQINDKTSFNLRAELNEGQSSDFAQEEITATLQYNLWANVLTRLEFRWDHTEHGYGYQSAGSGQPIGSSYYYGENYSNGTPEKDAFLLAAQLIYTF
jgi:hypothetical protein